MNGPVNQGMIVLTLVLALAALALALPMSVAADSASGTWASMISGTTNTLESVWGSSADDVFVVGGGGTIMHYDGNSWTSMSSGTTEPLYDIWGSGPDNVFAVGGGFDAAGTIVHYDGTAWTEMTSGATERLWGVWGSSSDDVFVVGEEGTILHYNGNSWSAMNSGITSGFRGVWGTSSSNVYAVGGSTVIHYDGNSWSGMDTGGSTVSLWDVWGSSSSDIFAVGYGVDSSIIHYDGDTWSEMISMTPIDLVDVWGSSSSDVFAVAEEARTILHYDGSTWSEMSGGHTYELYGVWGSSSADAFVVCGSGTILRYYLSPTVGSIDPEQGEHGESLDVIITGTSLTDAAEVSFGEGITVNSFIVDGATQITANITVDDGATIGPRDVSVTTPGGGGSLAGALDVVVPQPAIDEVSLLLGNQGETLEIVITGANFTGATAVSFGDGITVNSFNVDSATQMTISITIGASAPAGTRDVLVTTPGGNTTLAGGFTVEDSNHDLPPWVWVAIGVGALILGVAALVLIRRRLAAP